MLRCRTYIFTVEHVDPTISLLSVCKNNRCESGHITEKWVHNNAVRKDVINPTIRQLTYEMSMTIRDYVLSSVNGRRSDVLFGGR